MCKTEPPRGTLCLMPSLKTNKRRHPNNSVGMGKMSKINKRRAYCYSEVKSTCEAVNFAKSNSSIDPSSVKKVCKEYNALKQRKQRNYSNDCLLEIEKNL